jgi:hypothetical protein
MVGGACPVLAINLDLYGSVAAHHEYMRLNEGMEVFDPYLLINAKTRTTGSVATFAYFDVDWRLLEVFSHGTNEIVEESGGQVNEAYLSIRLQDNLALTVGKKRVLWGVGFAYNPTDFIDAPLSPFDPELKQGVYSSELTFFHHAYSLDSLLVFSEQPEDCGYGLKLSTFSLFQQTDLNFMGYYAKDDGLSLGMSVETTPFAAPFWRDLALYGEVGLVQSSFSQPKLSGDDFYQQWLAGVRYVHPATETSVILEYYYLEDGLDQKAREKIPQQQQWLKPGQSAQHSIFISIQRTGVTKNKHPFTDTLSLATWAFGNLADQSRRVTAAITSEVIKNTQISLESAWYIGDDDTEYGSIPIEQTYSLVLKIDF